MQEYRSCRNQCQQRRKRVHERYKGVSDECERYKRVSDECERCEGVSDECERYKGVSDECVRHRGVNNACERYIKNSGEDKRFHSATKYANNSQWRRTRQLGPEQRPRKEGCYRKFWS